MHNDTNTLFWGWRYAQLPFKRHPPKMVKHTQTIRQLLSSNCLSVFDHFVGLALKRLTLKGSIFQREKSGDFPCKKSIKNTCNDASCVVKLQTIDLQIY